MTKCSLTHEKCGAVDAGFWDDGDSCPLRRYKSSSRLEREQEEDVILIDDTCRYYGIARTKELQKYFTQED